MPRWFVPAFVALTPEGPAATEPFWLMREPSHIIGAWPPELIATPLEGLILPLILAVSPGLDQPPPGAGDGVRDGDISVSLGVPGMGDRRVG